MHRINLMGKTQKKLKPLQLVNRRTWPKEKKMSTKLHYKNVFTINSNEQLGLTSLSSELLSTLSVVNSGLLRKDSKEKQGSNHWPMTSLTNFGRQLIWVGEGRGWAPKTAIEVVFQNSLRWFLRIKSCWWIWHYPWMFSTKHCFQKNYENDRSPCLLKRCDGPILLHYFMPMLVLIIHVIHQPITFCSSWMQTTY